MITQATPARNTASEALYGRRRLQQFGLSPVVYSSTRRLRGYVRLKGVFDRITQLGEGILRKLANALQARKDLFSSLQSVATIVALIIGAAWALSQFERHRESYPNIEMSEAIADYPMPYSHTLLSVDVSVRNTSQVQLRPLKGYVTVRQVLPPPPAITAKLDQNATTYAQDNERTPDWGEDLAGMPEENGDYLEPGEATQLHYEFVLKEGPCLIQVLSRVDNPKVDIGSQASGWNCTMLYKLRPYEDCLHLVK